MTDTFTIAPGVTLRCRRDSRFKQGRMTVQLVRPMRREEASLNALLPTVLLRGTQRHPDLRSITKHLDDLYGATAGDLVRRIGDWQTTGFGCAFTEDRFALAGDQILAPTVEFLGELLLEPRLEEGVFCREFVETEKRNLICELEAQRNDKGSYAAGELLRTMCRGDSFAIPRLGEKEWAEKITAEDLYRHYQKVLKESPVEIFYVGSAEPSEAAAVLTPIFEKMDRAPVELPAQMPFRDAGPGHRREIQQITQSRLCLGYVTPITNKVPEFAAMQVMNTLFGSGMTSKLFMNIREKMSLCYSIGSGYYGSKGILTVSAGIDGDKEEVVRKEVEAQLNDCRQGRITKEELEAARASVLSALRAVTDSPGAMESYFSVGVLSGLCFTLEEYRAAVEKITAEDVAEAAKSLRYHSSFFLEGVSQ